MFFKKMILLVVILSLIFVSIPAAAQEDEPVTITMWTWFDDFRDVFPELVEEFNASQDEIYVEQKIFSLNEYLQILQSSIAGEEEPDILGPHTHVRGFGEAGVVIDFKDYLDEDYIDKFTDSTIKQYTWNDSLYALPWTAQTFGIFYNKDIFEEYDLEIPKTWDELIALGDEIREKTNRIQPMAFGNRGKWMGCDFYLPLITQVTDDPTLVLDMDRKSDVGWNRDATVEALELVQRLVNEEVFAPGANGLSNDQAINMFYNDRAAMYYAGSWIPQTFSLEAPDDLNWGVFKTPAYKEGKRHWTANESGANLSVSARSDHIEEAVEFVKYMFSNEVYAEAMIEAKGMPATKEAISMIEDPVLRKMTSWLEDGAPHILYGEGSWDAVANAVQGVIGGQLTPEEAAEQIQEDVERALSR